MSSSHEFKKNKSSSDYTEPQKKKDEQIVAIQLKSSFITDGQKVGSEEERRRSTPKSERMETNSSESELDSDHSINLP